MIRRLLIIYSFLLVSMHLYAADFTAVQDGNWNDVNTWGGSSFPNAETDNVLINYYTVSINGADALANNITLGENATLSFTTANTLTVFGDLTNAATIDAQNSTGISLKGAFYNSGTISNFTALDLTIDGPSSTILTLPKEITTLNSLTINKTHTSGQCTLDTNITITTDIVITSGNLSTQRNQLTISGNLTLNSAGTLSTDSSAVITLAGNLVFNSSLPSSFDEHSILVLSGTSTLTTPGTGVLTLNDITVNAASSLTSSGAFSISGDISNSGTWNCGSSTITFDNNSSALHAKTISSTSSMTFSYLTVNESSAISSTADIKVLDDDNFTFDVLGTGSFSSESGTITVGETGYTADLTINVANGAEAEFGDFVISNLNLDVLTSSDVTFIGDLSMGASAEFLASSPSIVKFKNTETNSTAKNIINSAAADKMKFFDLTIDNSSAMITTSSFQIKNDLTVNPNADFQASGSSTITFINSGTKTITNDGVLVFKHLTIEQGVSDNIVNTSSNFTIAGQLFAKGNDANPTNGSFKALANSKITITGNSLVTPSNQQTTTGNSIEFQDLEISATALAPNKSFIVNGDLNISGSLVPTSGTISFKGTGEQAISGTTATFSSITVDNIGGVNLETHLWCDDNITLLNGDIDLSGSHTITMGSTSSKLYESAGNTIKNSSAGEGSTLGGYISSQEIANKANVINTGLGLTIANGNSSDITVRRYHFPRTIDSNKSISRYYRLDYTGANIGDVTIEYDNSELNGNTASNLYLYYASSDDVSSWSRTSSTVTSTEGINTGSINITGLSGLGSPLYFVLSSLQISLNNLPYSGILEANEVASSPLTAGEENVNVLAFNINTPAAINQIDSIKISVNSATYTNQFEDYSLKYDTDQDLTTSGMTSTSASITYSNDTLLIQSISPASLSSGNNYFYLTADVSSTVTTSNATCSFTLADENVYLTSAELNDIQISGPSYSFTELLIDVDADNTPSGNLSSSATLTNQTFFAFTLTPPENPPSSTFTTLQLAVSSSSYTHFGDVKLWEDVNKNGYYDALDVTQLGSSATITASLDTLSFSSFSSTLSEEKDYIVSAIVTSSAQTYTNIKATIDDESWITVSSNAAVTPFSSTLTGNTMTVAESSTYSKLAIIDLTAVSPVEGFSSTQFESGQALSLTLESQDSNGYPQGVLSDTDVTFTISAGTATITNNSATITQYNSQVTTNNFTLSNPSGTIGVDVLASTTGKTSATFSSITIFATEPTVSPSSLVATNVTHNSASLTWSAGTPANHILIAKAGGIPSAPTKGTTYTQATGNSFSTPQDSTGTGSYVVYNGTGNTINITGLSASTEYYFTVYNYNGSGGGIRYLLDRTDGDMLATLDTTTQSTQPTTQTSGLSISNPSDTAMTLSWTNGNGAERIVIARLNSAVSTNPTDGVEYFADSSFGHGSQISSGFVVYAGTGSSVTVNNLAPSTTEQTNTYHFAVYEYNNSGGFENYLTTAPATASRRSLFAEPTIQASNIQFITGPSASGYYSDDNSVLVSWVNGNGTGRVVVCSSTLTSTELPSDAIVSYSNTPSVAGADVPYGTTDTIGRAFVIYNGTGETNSVRVTGLAFGYKYYFRAYEYNGSGAAVSTSTLNFLTDTSTDNPTSRISDRYEPNDSYDVLQSWQYIETDGTEYSGMLTDTNDEDWYYFEPNVADGQKNLRVVLKNLPANYELELYNYTGTRLMRKSFAPNNDDEVIILNNAPRGKYYIRIFTQYNQTEMSAYKFRVEAETGRFLSPTNY